MKIVILEKIELNENHKNKLRQLGQVEYYDNSTEDECNKRIEGADAVVVDWIDPSSFILSMKNPSILALMSTGFAWIKNRESAKKKGIIISNVPGYATEAVAEHLVGLMLGVARKTMIGDRKLRAGDKAKGYLEGMELKNKRLGVIGLGEIGSRLAEIAKAFGMEVVTFNRHKKNRRDIPDVSLEDLLKTSDVISICCPLNDDSNGMINKERIKLIKPGAILVGTTWNVVDINNLISPLKDRRIFGAGFDVAVEGGEITLPKVFLDLDNIILTPHVGYNTSEAKIRQIDICISNIESFKNGKPQNIVN